MLFAAGCSLGEQLSPQADTDQVRVGVEGTLTQEALSARETAVRETEQALEAVQDETAPVVSTPTSAPTETPTITPTVVHQVTPQGPATSPRSFILDTSSLSYQGLGYTVGDDFVNNHLERPFTSQEMVYRGYLDLTKANLYRVPPFSVVTLFLEGELPGDQAPNYAVELDLDKDGRGDVLITAELPPDSTWTTEGVRVLRDADGDVGGNQPLQAESPSGEWSGYEQEIFNNGRGEDPDLAWVRRDPEASRQVQIAYKENLQGAEGFLFWVWADQGVQDPDLFDFHDQWTLEEAGSPLENNPAYPLAALALVDSTCRAWAGFVPTGNEPGICGSYQPTDTPCYRVCVGPSDDTYCDPGTFDQCPADLDENRGEYCLACSEAPE